MPPRLERQLVRCAQHGDRDAFASLVQTHSPPIAKLTSRMLGYGPDAEDALQETLEHAWRTLPSFRGDAMFSTWLYRIAVNESLRCIARRQREHPVAPDDVVFEAASEPEAIVELVACKELVESFVRAASELPNRYRGAVLLCDVAGLSNCEGAGALGLHAANFKSRLHRGRMRLARTMHHLYGRG